MLNMRELYRDFHTSSTSFSELIPWMSMVGPDMIVNLDGSLVVFYSFKGVDAEGLMVSESDRYANLLEHGLKVCDDHVTLWSTVDRRKVYDYPDSHFNSEIGAAIDRAWKDQFVRGHQYANHHYMAFMYSAGKGAEGFFESVSSHLKTHQKGMGSAIMETLHAFTSKKVAIQSQFEQLDAMKVIFYSKLREFEETVTELGFKRLKNSELLSYLHTRCSPASANQPVAMPEVPAYLNTWLPDNTMHREHDQLVFKDIKDCHVGAITVKGWPNAASPGIIDSLLTAPAELTVSQIFRFVESSKAKRYIAGIEEHHRASSKSIITTVMEAVTKQPSDQVDTGKLMLAEDAQQAMQELTVSNRHYGYYNMTVLGYGETQAELEENLKIIASGLRQKGFILMRESLHLLAAFSSTMPGQWATSFRWSFMNIGNATDMAMIRTLDVGEKINKHLTEQTGRVQKALTVLPTEFSTPYYFSFHESDLAHTLVIGPAGSGKTSFVNFLISQFEKYTPCNRIIFDKDYSCWISTLIQDGSHIDMDLRSGASVKLNPFTLLNNTNNIIWLVDFVKVLATARGYVLGPDDDEDLLQAMTNLQKQPSIYWTLSNYVTNLSSIELKRQFSPWWGDGLYAKYFDNQQDEFHLNPFVAIEMGGLLDTDVAAPFMEYAFFRVNQMLDGKPTLIYIEECWFMLANKTFASRINDWLKTLRKKNAFVIMATQSLHEIATSDIFSSIIDNMQNRIYLANPSAYAHAEMYQQKFGLNSTQVDRIATAIPKQQYYIVTPKLARMVNARFPPQIMACTGADERSKAIFRKHYNNGNGGSNWQFNYVNERIS